MIKRILLVSVFTFICISLLVFAVKGQGVNPLRFQTVKDTSVGGPFESSNNTSRYALTEAIVEDRTFLLALINALLVAALARRLGGRGYSSMLAGFIFLFGTNALSYALTFTQHHASVTLTI